MVVIVKDVRTRLTEKILLDKKGVDELGEQYVEVYALIMKEARDKDLMGCCGFVGKLKNAAEKFGLLLVEDSMGESLKSAGLSSFPPD